MCVLPRVAVVQMDWQMIGRGTEHSLTAKTVSPDPVWLLPDLVDVKKLNYICVSNANVV